MIVKGFLACHFVNKVDLLENLAFEKCINITSMNLSYGQENIC